MSGYFSTGEVARARRYHRPLYLATFGRLVLVVVVYALLAGHSIHGLGFGGDAAAWAAVVVLVAEVVCLPLDLWRGYLRERRWGFSRQSVGGWAADRAKGAAVSAVLAAALWTGLVALPRWLPTWWVAAAAAAATLAVLVLSLIAPLVLEPLFNRFGPLADEELAASLRRLADAAGVPIRDVLVADASRRTTKANAYVSGIGPTRRVVVWDTLLASAGEPEVRLVVAHELGHRREGHVVKGTLLAMVGAVAAVLLLRAVLGTPEPGDFPLALLVLTALEVAAMPFAAALSRRWERVADSWSLRLTGDRDAFVRAHVSLARANLADLEPPRLAYLMLFSHPTPPERLASARGS